MNSERDEKSESQAMLEVIDLVRLCKGQNDKTANESIRSNATRKTGIGFDKDQARFEKLEKAYREFENIQRQLLEQLGKLSAEDAVEEEQIEEKYFERFDGKIEEWKYFSNSFRSIIHEKAHLIKGNTPFFRGINRGPAEAQSVSTRVKGIKSTSVKFTLLASVHAKTSAFVRRASQCLFNLFLYAVCSLRPSSHRSLGLPGALAWTADLIINPRSRRPSTKMRVRSSKKSRGRIPYVWRSRQGRSTQNVPPLPTDDFLEVSYRQSTTDRSP
ncbi:hypothetical protein ALC56_07196 [Trachymyrmex septentrionalis]|uniref:Uncharacterized protein n=1 Tax=Trachymyrmex septentrionalis TaxID=34720 RepID=A0A151JVY3_9HYME|nr:hypothetical protein ALC56_07196 [Trachymyrmex septentrionalis]